MSTLNKFRTIREKSRCLCACLNLQTCRPQILPEYLLAAGPLFERQALKAPDPDVSMEAGNGVA